MPKKRLKGLYKHKKSGYYYINKQIRGRRVHYSTGEKTREGAERWLENWLKGIPVLDMSAELTFRDAAVRHLLTSTRKELTKDAGKLARIFPFLADQRLDAIDAFSIQPFVEHLLVEGRKGNTINGYLSLIGLILRKCGREWKKADGRYWLAAVPHIPLHSVTDARLPYPIGWAEQRMLLPLLPEHLKAPVLFGLNTGLRDSEICGLTWSQLRQLPDSGLRYFLIPASAQKNKRARCVALNTVAQRIVQEQWESREGDHVFTYQGRAMCTLRNDGWLNAVARAAQRYEQVFGMPCPEEFRRLRVHDIRHTVARRARAAEVPELDIAAILGHSSAGGVTGHYADAEIAHMARQLDKIAEPPKELASPTLRVVASRYA